MRLIDADALKAWFFRPYSNEESYSNLDVAKVIDAQPTAPRWVRCEDELPKENGWYLTIDEFGDCNACEWDNTLKWSGITKYEATLLTHWMPIEPPKEGV